MLDEDLYGFVMVNGDGELVLVCRCWFNDDVRDPLCPWFPSILHPMGRGNHGVGLHVAHVHPYVAADLSFTSSSPAEEALAADPHPPLKPLPQPFPCANELHRQVMGTVVKPRRANCRWFTKIYHEILTILITSHHDHQLKQFVIIINHQF